MPAYYNEFDPFAAQWLRELIKKGLIADGEVDERSITDVQPEDIREFTQCHFFAGIGVWSYALRQAGWRDNHPVWTGSCPCQPFSSAGKGKGFNDERHLWPEFYRLISQCRPTVCFGEQVASKPGLAWIDLVQTDMEEEGYAFGAVDTCAAGVGAPHIRQRIYWVADASSEGFSRYRGLVKEPISERRERAQGHIATDSRDDEEFRCAINGFWRNADWMYCRDGRFRPIEPGTFPLAYGTPARVGRLRGYGNAINAEQAKAFIEAYLEVEA